jgi:hypothetical protein
MFTVPYWPDNDLNVFGDFDQLVIVYWRGEDPEETHRNVYLVGPGRNRRVDPDDVPGLLLNYAIFTALPHNPLASRRCLPAFVRKVAGLARLVKKYWHYY